MKNYYDVFLPIMAFADHIIPTYSLDADQLREECRKLNSCGIVPLCEDSSMKISHKLLREIGIPCNSLHTDELVTDKHKMRNKLAEIGMPAPKYTRITDKISENLVETLKNFQYPLICKPVDMTGSTGVIKISSFCELESGIYYSLSHSNSKEVVLEEFVNGKEYSAECIAYNGEYSLLTVTETITTEPPYFVEIGHRQPAALRSEMIDKIEQTLYRIFEGFGIKYGAAFADFRITDDGRIVLMEVGSRMIADCIGTSLVNLSTGYDYVGMVINIACGKSPSFEKTTCPGNAQIKYITTEADIKEYDELKKRQPELIQLAFRTDLLPKQPLSSSAERGGFYIISQTG